MRTAPLGHPRFALDDRRAWRNFPVILLHFLARYFWRDIAGDHERHIVWAVVRLEPFLDVAHGCRIKVFHRADYRPRVWMAGWGGVVGENLLRDSVRLVFTLALFVLHHAALQIEFFLIQDAKQVAHAVAFC